MTALRSAPAARYDIVMTSIRAGLAVVLVLHGCATATSRRIVSATATDREASTTCLQQCATMACLDACPGLVVEPGTCADVGLVAIDHLPGDRAPGTEDRRCYEHETTRPWFVVVASAAILAVIFGALLYNSWGSATPSHG